MPPAENGKNAKNGNNGSPPRQRRTPPPPRTDRSHGSHPPARERAPHASHSSHSSHPPPEPRFLKPRGDYRTLLSYQKAETLYDLTFRFARKYLDRRDRTIDQMIQAARSGKQNILEGSKAGTTSKETEIKLTNVARASLQELLADYEDYLRVRDLPIWDKESREAQYIRRRGRKIPQTFELYRTFFETRPPETVANIAICLLNQTNYLLDRQLRRLEKDFTKDGGLRERMTRTRLNRRDGRAQSWADAEASS